MVTANTVNNILDSATHVAVIVVDFEGKILLFSSGAVSLFGYEEQEALGKPLQKLTFCREDQASNQFEDIVEGVKSRGWIEEQLFRRHKTGMRFSTISNFTSFIGAMGECRGILEVAQEVPSDLLNLERELKISKKFIVNILESSIDAVVTTDIKGRITYANRAFRELIGLPGHQIIGKHIFLYYRGGIERARRIMDKLKEHGRIRDYEFDMEVNGRIIPIRTSDTLLYDENGEIVGTMGVFQDISTRKRLSEELSATQAELIQAVKMKALGDLVAGVAHEIYNPLMASDTSLHLLENETRDHPILQKRVSLLKRCNQRIKNIVKKLKEFSIQAGTEFSPMDVTEAIVSVLEIAHQQILNQRVGVDLNLQKDLPKVLGDKNQIEQVLLNLISNACDAMERSARKVLTITTSYDRESRQVLIDVKDTGMGIKMELMEQIFNPFFTTKDADKGMGLGLSICYRIVEAHGGKIDVQSRVNEGSEFTVILPSHRESGKSSAHKKGDENGTKNLDCG